MISSVVIAICCFAGLVGGVVFAYLIYGKVYTSRERKRYLEQLPQSFEKNFLRYYKLALFVGCKCDRSMTDEEFVAILDAYIRFMKEFVFWSDKDE